MSTILVSIPFGAVISLQVGNLTGQIGAQYGRVNLNLNQDPPPCTDGYLPASERRSPNETSFVEFFLAECRSVAPVNMRGMKYAPAPRTIDVLIGAN